MTQEARLNGADQDTILMVERLISKKREFDSTRQLRQALPKQVRHPTLEEILEHLEDSNKIMVDKDGGIAWIFTDNPKLEKLHADSVLLR